jgi:hypothetical protein
MMIVLRALALSMLVVAPISTESTEVKKSTRVVQIQKMLDRWQARLGLGTWRIEAQIVPPSFLGPGDDGSPTVADIVYDIGQRSAAIRVQHAPPDEVEEALVHELNAPEARGMAATGLV